MSRQLTNHGGKGYVRVVFSLRRAVLVFGIAFLIVLSDMLLIHILGVKTLEGLVEQTIIVGVGLYLAYTMRALFGNPFLHDSRQ